MTYSQKITKGWLRTTAIILCLTLFTPVSAQYTKAQNLFYDPKDYRNWELTAGIEGMSFSSLTKKVQNLSTSPLSSSRFTLGATFGIGKWFNPYIGESTNFSGYWGKAIVSSEEGKNDVRFYSLEEHVLFNVSNLIAGPNYTRVYNFIPHIGLGFVRDCTHNENTLGIHAGLKNTFRLGRHMDIYADLGYHVTGTETETSGRYTWFSAELGLQFKIGKNKARKTSSYLYRNSHDEVSLMNLSQSLYSDGSYGKEKTKEDEIAEQFGVQGMTLVRRGSVKMGDVDNDSLWGRGFPSRTISVDDFWMDQTEITNAQYKEFVQDVVDNIIRQRIKDPFYNDDLEKVKESLYVYNPITGERTLDGNQIIYCYETYDEVAEKMRQNRMDPKERTLNPDLLKQIINDTTYVEKDTAYIDSTGQIIRATIRRPLSSHYDFLNTYAVNILPDTTCWVNDFPNSNNLMYMKYYYSSKDYDNYPVVGVTWEQASAYCAWRTEKRRIALGGSLGMEQPYRLPTEAEWEVAARGCTKNLFPWNKESVDEHDGYALLANFQPDDGDYTKDGNIITSKVGIYPPNDNGLYDMAGNVAEWTSTAYSAAGVEVMNNVNPQVNHNSAIDDPYRTKRKVVKGGSWKDSESHILSAWRVPEYQNQPRSYIGFRCCRSIPTKPSERVIRIKK